MIGFCPLASGSKGNCLYIGTHNTRILIDAGLSRSEIEARLKQIDVPIESIQAIFVTHEHIDHIRALPIGDIVVCANADTAKAIAQISKKKMRFKIFTTGETFQFGDLEIHPFSIPHDTLDPVGFTVQAGPIKIGICADIGHVTSLIKKHLMGCDYLYIEANHDPSMVRASSRPKLLQDRILSKQGHLSNGDCAALVSQVYHPGLKHVFLAHLSEECNAGPVALSAVETLLAAHNQSVAVSVAYQDKVSKHIVF